MAGFERSPWIATSTEPNFVSTLSSTANPSPRESVRVDGNESAMFRSSTSSMLSDGLHLFLLLIKNDFSVMIKAFEMFNCDYNRNNFTNARNKKISTNKFSLT